ncbi:hypothetical protein [Microbispora sp. H10670]|uniref:hypothetical protein n=1 Tax=Microbispora sp. H10670 TaxID=2729108 RepID=UPI0016009787|nr:hypothetical protein [Microbispora sp. H10670]
MAFPRYDAPHGLGPAGAAPAHPVRQALASAEGLVRTRGGRSASAAVVLAALLAGTAAAAPPDPLSPLLSQARAAVREQPGMWTGASVARGERAVVVGAPRRLVAEVARLAGRADRTVTRVWGEHGGAVILVPRTEEQAAALAAPAVVGGLAAVATGDRVIVQPAAFARLSAIGRQVVVTHELTHVAASGPRAVPMWLLEGFADYVGYLDSGLPVHVVAAELAAELAADPRAGGGAGAEGAPQAGAEPGAAPGTESAGTESAGTESAGTESAGTESAGTESAGTESAGTESAGTESAGTESAGTESAGTGAGPAAGTPLARLPEPADFAARPAQAYEEAWLACRYIAARFGERRLVALYRAALREDADAALRNVLGLTTAELTRLWRSSVRAELARS